VTQGTSISTITPTEVDLPLDWLTASTDEIRSRQWQRLRQMLAAILPTNRFYARKLSGMTLGDLRDWSDFERLPFTTKAELATDQLEHPPYGSNLTEPLSKYHRLHQSSGTSTGRPLRWLDTPRSWRWLLRCWQWNFLLMNLQPTDRLFFPFSFGPFLGFWTAFEAAAQQGQFCLAGGGISSTARLHLLQEHRCTVVCATPTYAWHLAEVAHQAHIDLATSGVRALIVAGEPGGSITSTRQRLQASWGCRVFDHYGLTEVGPTAMEAVETPGELLILEPEYIVEVVAVGGQQPVPEGQEGELVVTNLGRWSSPLIRYRTGDVIRLRCGTDPSGRNWRRISGGVLGRVDDMIHLRGNNLYPATLEAILRRFPEVAEYRIVIVQKGPLTDLRIEVEPCSGDGQSLAAAIAEAIRNELLFRVDVLPVPPNSLPRFEMKARRICVVSP
jgi:phenylacetate-CoA ligase